MNLPTLIMFAITLLKTLLLLALCSIVFVLFVACILLIYWRSVYAKRRAERHPKKTCVAFFHPYCNAGGGGERVLWAAVKAIQSQYADLFIVVYTGDLDADPEQIINRVERTFDIKIQANITFVYLHRRKWVEASMYPYFTLLGQSLGSIWLGIEALNKFLPDIYIDTMGYAFTYPLFNYIGGCRVGTYTHYPTISTDMLRHVYKRIISHNNRRIIARNPFLSAMKILYYRLFALFYGWAGRSAEIILVNSSWTEDHINAIWKCPLKTHKIYPPCNVQHLMSLPLLDSDEKNKQIRIVSVCQFRPEKGHPLMLRALFELRSIVSENLWEKIKLVFIGSCRGKEDEIRVKDMQDLSKHLALDENVEFKLNIPHSELVAELQKGTIGLHAMWNEHFGISVVESMAAGLIMVAHASGGPNFYRKIHTINSEVYRDQLDKFNDALKEKRPELKKKKKRNCIKKCIPEVVNADIIEVQPGSQTGFLAEEPEEYANTIAHIINLSPEEKESIRIAARASVNRFSTDQFEKEFLRAVEPFFRPKQE